MLCPLDPGFHCHQYLDFALCPYLTTHQNKNACYPPSYCRRAITRFVPIDLQMVGENLSYAYIHTANSTSFLSIQDWKKDFRLWTDVLSQVQLHVEAVENTLSECSDKTCLYNSSSV